MVLLTGVFDLQDQCQSAALASSTAAAASPDAAATAQPGAAADVAAQLAVLVLEQSSWFQPAHFAASAVGLAALGVIDPVVWDNFTAAAEHKVGAFTFAQLATTMEALAVAG